VSISSWTGRVAAALFVALFFAYFHVIAAEAQTQGAPPQPNTNPPAPATPGEQPQLQPAESLYLPQINVVGVTPLSSTGIPANEVPANVQSYSAQQIQNADHPDSVLDVLDHYSGSVTLSNTEGNPFQQNLNLRGFTSSPVLGTPQGIAVYQNGVRINEPFGDVVFWDLIPAFAVNEMQVIPGSDPVYGLNALGGAITLQMKNGFNFQGAQMDFSGGSWGRRQTTDEYGIQYQNFAAYTGIKLAHEDGWRQFSASDLVQSFSDLAARGDNFDLGLSLTLAASSLFGQGADPAQELDADRTAIFTYPDNARDRLVFLQGRGNYELTSNLSLQSVAYYRHSGIRTSNGDTSGFGDCAGPPVLGPAGELCDDNGPLTQSIGSPSTPNGPINDTMFPGTGILGIQRTITNGFGGSLQGTDDESLFGLKNNFIAGGSFDYADAKFSNETQLAELYPIAALGFGTMPDPILLYGPDYNTKLDAVNRYYGLFATDTLNLTDALTATVSGRLNIAQVALSDEYTPDAGALNGDHHFIHFNPAGGLTYQINPELNVYGSFGESNRIPTAAELSCADPTQPCRFPAGFVSDPALKQVVAQTVELGARGKLQRPVFDDTLALNWSADVYGAQNSNDIIFVASGPFIGSGYFDNAGDTRRLGAELNVDATWNRFDFHASYGFVRATYQSNLAILSPSNPAADANGFINVKPGDRLPNIPENSTKLGIGYQITPEWHVGLDLNMTSSQYLTGDEANLQKKLPGYAVLNFSTSYDVTKWCRLYFIAENITDNHYNSFGIYGDPTGDGAFPAYTDPRFYTPAPPFGFWAGVRLRF
jgi:iron complex outermembrane receptor protein